ncbi:MAG: SGNH/GDSL hydrolase family protein [Desulfarculaceae bacterium]|nr:SGNH/GDSL hydrolase family protein [Desulfarculaceae bacterium]
MKPASASQKPAPSTGKTIVFGSICLVLSVVIGFVLMEIGYRAFLYYEEPEKFMFMDNIRYPYFGVYNQSHWAYSKEFGFTYPPGKELVQVHIQDGKVSSFARVDTINRRGNIGPIKGDYKTADFKICLFGDSFPAFIVRNQTFPVKLQDVLSQRLNKSVHVVNFGRDGTGILQMFDLAAAKVPEWKPDLVIFTFITNDLCRKRIWRKQVVIDGEDRVLVTDRPTENITPDIAQDAYIIDTRITYEWAKNAKKTGVRDELVKSLEKKYLRMADKYGYWFPDPFTLKRSFLLNRLIYGDPYHSDKKRAFKMTSLSIPSYGDDPQFMKKVRILKQAKVPIALVHLPIYPEVKEGKEYVFGLGGSDKIEASLLKSLEDIMGIEVIQLTKYFNMPLKNAEKMNASPTNYHPSLWGMNLYAQAITKALIARGYIPKKLMPQGE